METKQTAVEWLNEYFYLQLELYESQFDHAKELEHQQLEAAFKAGWMRANATNYDDSYFQHFLSETYDNHWTSIPRIQ